MDTQIIVAAAKVFGISEEVAALHVEQLSKAPIFLVEHDGYLKGERKKDYDARREDINVYTGDYKTLVKRLKSIGGQSLNGMTPWEIIFTYYKSVDNDLMSIMEKEEEEHSNTSNGRVESSDNSSMQDNDEVVDESTVTTTPVIEQPIEMNAYVKKASEKEADDVAATQESATSTTYVHGEESTYTNTSDTVTEEPATPMSDNKNDESENAMTPTAPLTREFDVVVDADNKQGTAKCTNKKETIKMSDLTEMAKNIAGGTANSGNVSAPVISNEEVNSQLKELMQSTMETRKDFVLKNNITKLIATSKSVRDRLVTLTGIKGPLVKASGVALDAAADINTKLEKRLKSHLTAVYGKAIEYAEWAALDKAVQFQNCASQEDAAMAEKIINSILAAKADHTKQFDLIAPAESNLSYKGLYINDTPYTPVELSALLTDNTMGQLFAAGMIDNLGEKTAMGKDKDTLIQVAVNWQSKSSKASAEDNSIKTTAPTKTYVQVAALTGKKNLIKQNAVAFLYPEVDTQSIKPVQLLVALDGVAASYKVFKLDANGNKIEVKDMSKEKDANGVRPTKPATRTVSLKGSGEAYAVIKSIDAAYVKEGATEKDACTRWGVATPAVDRNNVFPEDATDTIVFKIITNSEKNPMTNNGSQLQNQYLGFIQQKNQAEAADAANALGA